MKKWLLLLFTTSISFSLYAQRVDNALSDNCVKFLDFYGEYYKRNNYEQALSNWRKAYRACPAGTRQFVYIDGAKLYRWLLDTRAYNQSQRDALLDTLVTINALRAYCYPNFAQEAQAQINNDLNLYSGDNTQLRNELLKKTSNIEAIIDASSPEDVSSVASTYAYDIRHRIAILSPKVTGKATLRPIEISIIRGEICHAITSNSNYHAFTRSDVDKLLEEQQYQGNGLISAKDRKRIGVMSGIDEICSLTVNVEEGKMLIEASLIDINSGEITTSTYAYGPYDGLNSISSLKATCEQIGRKLIGAEDNTKVTSIKKNKADVVEGRPYTENVLGIDMEMIYVPGGVYHPKKIVEDITYNEDGSIRSIKKNVVEHSDESVYIEPFYIAKYPLTQKQWRNVMETTPEDLIPFVPNPKRLPLGDQYPMYNLGPLDAEEFCEVMSEMTGLQYDIPTGDEWECAAFGGNNTRTYTLYSGSDDINEVGWPNNLMPVGLKKPNALGIYDMSGFLYEYVKYGMRGGPDFICKSHRESYHTGESFRVIMRPKKK